MQHFAYLTSEGKAVVTAERPAPNVLLIHGFKRRAQQVAGWADRVPDLGFLHLPGHSGAPEFSEVTLEAWTRGFREMIAKFPQPPLIIAESLGAMVAMSLPCRALIAVEPLLSTDQLWPLHRTIRIARSKGIVIEPALEALFEKPFDWAPGRISAPTLVIAGQEPLLPEREVYPEPSLLTDEDFGVYARHPLVEAVRIPGGHSLLDTNPNGVAAASRDFMIRHGYLPSEGPPDDAAVRAS